MKPEVLSKFFTKYNNAKLPKDTIIENVLREEFNVPKDRIQSVLQLIKDNGEFTGVFRETKTGTFILIDNPQPTEHDNNTGEVTSPSEEIPKELAEKLDIINPASHPVQSTQPIPQDKPKVFISVTQEVAGSSPVHTASLRIKQLAEILRLFHCSVKVFSI